MNNLMLDLETLGIRPGCIVISIGAVLFDPDSGALGQPFYSVISAWKSKESGLEENEDTINWWKRQSKEARKTLIEATDDQAPDPVDVFREFNEYIHDFSDPKKVLLWGNGSDFDNAILVAAYEKLGAPLGWNTFNHRCFRTLKNMRPEIKVTRSGTHHNALDDAITQAHHAIQILKDIK